jgi:hypothetical protein
MRGGLPIFFGLALCGGAAASCGATVEMGPGSQAIAPAIVTVVEMPPSIDWAVPGADRRAQRIAGDSLLEVTGGRAVIADELPGPRDSDVQAALRALGEDASHALTFTISVGIGRRLVKGANPIHSFEGTRVAVIDYIARVEVRMVGAPDVIGTVESIQSGPPNEPEASRGAEKRGAAAAIDEALEAAVRAFAPGIYTPRRPTLVVEVPTSAAHDLVKKTETLQQLYPEVSVAELQLLAESRERFLVVEPGHFAKLGVVSGDLLGVPGGETRASRAALARAVARGGKPLVAIIRGGQRYIVGL